MWRDSLTALYLFSLILKICILNFNCAISYHNHSLSDNIQDACVKKQKEKNKQIMKILESLQRA